MRIATSTLLLSPFTLALPPLPRLNIVGKASVSGISSGADFASQVLVAHSDRFFAAGAFAGQAYGCATMRFPAEPLFSCSAQPPSQQGPGCVGLNSTGPAPCIGCPPAATVAYDHCKNTPSIISVDQLRDWAAAGAAAGTVAPLEGLSTARIYTYRGTKDEVYKQGCVNATGEFFAPLVANPGAQLLFEAGIPSTHSMPTVDPHVPASTCGVGSANGLQNCGYDGVGAMLQFFYDGALLPPPQGATGERKRLLNFSQDLYGNASAQFGGLASFGLAYIPDACRGGGAPLAGCTWRCMAAGRAPQCPPSLPPMRCGQGTPHGRMRTRLWCCLCRAGGFVKEGGIRTRRRLWGPATTAMAKLGHSMRGGAGW